MAKVLLYGHLGQKFGRSHEYQVGSPNEAIRALRANFKGFEQEVLGHGGGYHILVGYENKTLNEMVNPISQDDVIRIIPTVSGAGFEAGLASFLSGFMSTAAAATVAAAVTNILVSMVIMGVANALFAPDKPDIGASERPENKPSHSFNGPVNTVAQGHPVPVGYGRMRVGSQVVSAGLYVEQI